uniref:Uncharacterized protein n=1 Tax=Desertifilum tharense IPPAS B-1220 TaxID=1781255 RepID=A0ACD5GSG6_9CYAN
MPRLSDNSVPTPSTENPFHPQISQILEQIADAVLLLDAHGTKSFTSIPAPNNFFAQLKPEFTSLAPHLTTN